MSQQTDIELVGIPKYAWLLWVVFGALSAAVGIWLILSPKAALGTLAILFGFGLLFNGIAELATASDHPSPTFSYVIAAIFIIAGIMVFMRPVSGLFGLALIVGLSMIITGIAELVVAFTAREAMEHWLLLAFLGAVGIITGILAISWPVITVMILAIILGCRLLISGLVQVGMGLRLKSAMA